MKQTVHKILGLLGVVLWLVLFSPMVDAQPLKIEMILWRGETLAEKGFQTYLKKQGMAVDFHIFNANQSREKLANYLRYKFNPKHWDYVYTFGTTASFIAKQKINNQVPHIFNIVADPVKAGLVTELQGSKENITGVTNGVSLYLQIENAKKILNFKRLAFFFNPREKNSMIIRERLRLLSEDFDFDFISFRSPPVPGFLEKNLQRVIDNNKGIDVVYLPSDSYLQSKAALIGETLKQANIKSIAAQKSYLDHGAYLGTVPDYFHLGELAGEAIVKHQQGVAFGNIPVQRDESPKVIINPTWQSSSSP